MEMLFKFKKKQDMVYISHLDLLRLFQRAARRADLPIFITEGFNPHYKISIKKALKLGIESESEEGAFKLLDFVDTAEFIYKINGELPKGIEVYDAEVI